VETPTETRRRGRPLGSTTDPAKLEAQRIARIEATAYRAATIDAPRARIALDAAGVNAKRVMLELARVAFADVRQLYDEHGNMIPPHLMDDDTAATITAIDVEVSMRGSGENAEPVITKKIRRADKMGALTLLAKHFKIVGDEGDGVNALASALADRLDNARRRLGESQVEDVPFREVGEGSPTATDEGEDLW